MTWAAHRKTSRTEDIAYSLLGIFGVNMPLLYGEGDKAFIRLQEEILKETDDESLFTWGMKIIKYKRSPMRRGILAQTPMEFLGSEDVIPIPKSKNKEPHSMTNRGLRLHVPLIEDDHGLIAIPDCQLKYDFTGPLGIR